MAPNALPDSQRSQEAPTDDDALISEAAKEGPDGQIPGTPEQQKAYRFLEKQLASSAEERKQGATKSLNFVHNTVCHLRCTFRYPGRGPELQLMLPDVALQSIKEMGGMIAFSTSDGNARFWAREDASDWKKVNGGVSWERGSRTHGKGICLSR
ncbi:hypothetical protein [uncultured Thiodictyon sp.]|uniref:hypothetical protein n=1 Tax=uncultured Thiodictyon sp. TaxID=1846217 RepID=UPI0025F95CD0|nr:hypothetical protein [uncultured Thiodictyon sp.]